MKKKRLICLVLAAVLTSFLFSALSVQAAEAPEFEWNVSFSYGESAAAFTVGHLENISEKSGGRIKFNYYYSNSLIGVMEQLDALGDGRVEISSLATPMYPDQLIYSGSVFSIPMIPYGDNFSAIDCWLDYYDAFPEVGQELEDYGIYMWCPYTMTPYVILYTGDTKAPTTPDEFQGQTVIVTKPEFTNVIGDNNGAPMYATVSDYYSILERSIANAVACAWGHAVTFGLTELITGSLEFEDGLYYELQSLSISLDAFNQLPDDIKQLFYDEREATIHDELVRAENQAITAQEVMYENGGERTIISDPETLAIWKEALDPQIESTLSEYEAAGKPKVREMYDWLVNYCEENFKQ